MSKMLQFTEEELRICLTANLIEDGARSFAAGGGAPILAMLLAKRLHAPNSSYVTEDGVMDPQPKLPIPQFSSMVSSHAGYRAVAWGVMNTVIAQAQIGLMDYGVLASLQMDPYGNINSAVTGGSYYEPGRRFGGPGGADFIAGTCWRTIIMTELQKRKFVPRVDFISSPGYLTGPGAREQNGMPEGTGPYRVVCGEAVFGYDDETKWMKLLEIAPWLTVDHVLAEMQFKPLIAEPLGTIKLPTEEQLKILREDIDPMWSTIAQGKTFNVEVEDDGTYIRLIE